MLSQWSIRAKLLFCLVLFAAAFVAVAATLNVGIRSNTAAFDTLLNDRVRPLREIKAVADAYAVSIVDSAHKARNGNITMDEAARQVELGRQRIAENWQAYRATSIADHEADLARAAERDMSKADAEVATLEAILQRQDRAALDSFVVHRLYAAIDPVSGAMSALTAEQIKIAEQVTADAGASNDLAGTLSIIIALIIAMVWLFALQVARKSVILPIATLANTMEMLAANKDAAIPFTGQTDEMGRMARACEIFRQAALDRTRAEAENARMQMHVTGALRSAIAAISAGNLTGDIREAFPAQYEPVRNDFNSALASLRQLIGAVSDSTTAIRIGSEEIAHASEDLARRTESNAASLEETSAALTQIDGRLKATAHAADSTVQRADQALANVGNGRAIADRAVQAMSRVADSAHGIDSVIEGVDKIAFQTRVLAMNAAVEAGRAGEAGRGFAVVADLVSALAMRAEEEAKRARDQLTVTQTDIVTAVDAVQKVDGALANISGDVDQVHHLLDIMAADNKAQSSAITEISAAIGSMDRSTQQNAAMVEETSAAARNLVGEVGTLTRHAARFRVDDTGRDGLRPAATSSLDHRFTGPTRRLSDAAVSALTCG